MAPGRVSEPVTPLPQATLLATRLAGRYRPGQRRDHNGFPPHVFATSPWPGAIVTALIVIVGLALALDQDPGRCDGRRGAWHVSPARPDTHTSSHRIGSPELDHAATAMRPQQRSAKVNEAFREGF